MKLLLLILALCVTALVVYWVWNFYHKFQISKELIDVATPYSLEGADHSKTVLVIGDSTGVGVGAEKAEDSLPGRVASAVHATYVENRAVSGAVVTDLPAQIAQASLERYDIVLIQIGGNDITHFHDAEKTTEALESVVQSAVSRSDTTILLTAGNVGAASILPPPIRPFYTKLNLQYHTAFSALAEKVGAVYVNLYRPPLEDPFVRDPQTYLAADGFHPSGAGYGVWFNVLEKAAHDKLYKD